MSKFGKLKIKNVGVFEIHSFDELESIVNDKDSELRIKFKGFN